MNNPSIINNTHLSDSELEYFKNLLLAEKESAEKEIAILKKSIENIENNLAEYDSSSAHHQSDIGSVEELRKTNYTLIEKQKEKLEKIAQALNRIETGDYGVCMVTGKYIQKERLEALPYTLHAFETLRGNVSAGSKKGLGTHHTM